MNREFINPEEITAEDYFDYIKDKRNTTSLVELREFRKSAIYLIEKYRITNQIAAMKKLMFLINNAEKEKEAVEKGIDQYVYREDIQEFIRNVSSKVVKIIELENYPREIPDDIVEKYQDVEDVFDNFYVVFTDYTGEVEKQVEKSKIDKDPILFGAFKDTDKGELGEKFYYIGDWIDEYCDLTLEKMVTEMKEHNKKDISHPTKVPDTLDKLRDELDKYTYERGVYIKKEKPKKTNNNITKKSSKLFDKVKGWFS